MVTWTKGRAILLPTALSLAAVLTSTLVAQGDAQERSLFSCAMHPQLRMSSEGNCPICGLKLLAIEVVQIQIPPGGLRDYCERYVEEALRERNLFAASAFQIVSGYLALKGKDSHDRVRDLLDVRTEQDWMSAAAFYLGRSQDRESIPLLKKLLVDDKLAISQLYYCQKHPEMTADLPGECSECEQPLRMSVGHLSQQLCVAGALHDMGVAEGLDALEAIVEMPMGYLAFPAMALRDSPRVRQLLAVAAKAEAEHIRAAAISAQLRLGIDENFQEAIRLLRRGTSQTRDTVIDGLGDSSMTDAIEPLVEIVRDNRLPQTERVPAAHALVKLGERKYLGFLLDTLHKTVGEDRFAVCYALAEVGDKSALQVLETVIENDRANRSSAVRAAARILGREAKSVEGR